MFMQKTKILFVDDDPHFLDSLKRNLRYHDEPWELYFSKSAEEALIRSKNLSFDVIISDMKMPGQNGFDFLGTLRCWESTKDIPVVLLTGCLQIELKQQALDLGAVDLLHKPVNVKELIARINNVLRVKIYQDQLKNQNGLLEQEIKKRTTDIELLQRDIVWRLAKAGELRDDETGYHVTRVALHSKLLASTIGLPDQVENMIFLTAPLHDIGKIGIPDSILLKPGPLDTLERQVMENHCQFGSAVLKDSPRGMLTFKNMNTAETQSSGVLNDSIIRETAVAIAMSHHEKWDGSGYPHGLKKDDIPIAGRIVALADVYDALRSVRPYKQKYSQERACEIIVNSSGSHFDPDLVDVFLGTLNHFESIRTDFSD